MLMAFSGTMVAGVTPTLRGLLAHSYAIRVDGAGFLHVVAKLGAELTAALAIPLLLLALAAVGGNMIQHRLVWSAEPLKPKLSKISPAAGFKRLFSKQALANFIKGLLKLGLIGAVMTALMWPERHRLDALVVTDVATLLPIAQSLSLKVLGAVVAILALIAAADYLFQYRVWFERQKMSLRELKEEFKQTEGDPAVKGKIRQIRQTRMRKRMMAAVPEATVVITNPTHYAVALKYERGMNAPVCVAKGLDQIARKIREVAGENAIPIVENPPLARALHGTVEIDQEIPAEHYQAVAEVIGYVMRLNRSMAAGRP
jgi:flagellar biosynthetic protein FlhB